MTRNQKLKKSSQLLKIYSQKLTFEIEKKQSSYAFQLNIEYRNPDVAYIKGFIIFRTGWILEFNEILEQQKLSVIKRKYRYHLMNKEKQLIFRYDNVAHHTEIKTYPHHKHIENNVIDSNNPTLLEVIDEVEKLILN
jgi:Zn-dependent metalloprotease